MVKDSANLTSELTLQLECAEISLQEALNKLLLDVLNCLQRRYVALGISVTLAM